MGGIKYDKDKLRYDLLPIEALDEVVAVLTFGAKKYNDNNWRKGFRWSRVIAALLRHITAFMKGENLDPESGKHHLAHAICCALFLLTFALNKVGLDDRYMTKPDGDEPWTP